MREREPDVVEPLEEAMLAERLDLERQRVATADGSLAYDFAVDPFRKQCLLNGWDDIGLTLRHTDEIRAFEARHLAEQPWL